MVDPCAPVARRLFQKVVRHLHEVIRDVETPCEAQVEFLRQYDRGFFANGMLVPAM